MNLEASAFKFGAAGRVPGDGAGGVETDAGGGSAHGFVHRAGAVQKMSIGGEEFAWQNWKKQECQQESWDSSSPSLVLSVH
jgi:hypothetical protein